MNTDADVELDLGDGASPFVVTFEEYDWAEQSSTFLNYGRRQREAMSGPYRAAIVPPIADAPVDIDRDALVDAVEATAEIARFDAEIGNSFAPFAALLLRTESAASSNIEQLTASAKAILMAEDGDASRRNATIIAGNTSAMKAAIALADEPSENSIIEMHRALMERSNPKIVGQWRDQQVWIGGTGLSPHGTDFVPPHHSRIPAAMADLVAFMRRTDVDGFSQAMIAHAQFETIHPFPDGNGRTGRALIHAHLRHVGVTRNVTVPISAGLLASTDDYFEALGRYRDGDASSIVRLAAAATHRSIVNGRMLVEDIAEIRQGWADKVASIRSDSVVHKIVADLPAAPLIDAKTIEQRYGVSGKSAADAVARLVDLGIVRKVSGDIRYRKFLATEISDALDAFAERAGQRTL